MPEPTPSRHMGTQCGQMVDGNPMSFQCSLVQGHAERPAEDPEPHYAAEVNRSVRAWRAWRARQDERDREEQEFEGTRHPGCPDDGVLRADLDSGAVTCTGCDLQARVVSDQTSTPGLVRDPTPPVDDLAAQFSAAGRPRGAPITEPTRPRSAPAPQDPPTAGLSVTAGPGLSRLDSDHPNSLIDYEELTGKGLRQRPGDQPLPTKNDWPSAHDEAVEFMRSRKDLGLRRYGSVLQPFNGRDGLLDLQEELADALAYVARLRQAQAATRDDLVRHAVDRVHAEMGAGFSGALADLWHGDDPPLDGLVAMVVDALVEHFPAPYDYAPAEALGSQTVDGVFYDQVVGYRRRS